jgi:excalibur calcium-binding domain-containing protein
LKTRVCCASAAALAASAVLAAVGVPRSATAARMSLWQNCTHVHTKYRHGVGRANAHDHTSGTPVTNFYRSTRLYNVAMRYNLDLDRDRDGIACEKR